ncbi:hypothetical protein HNY73_011582 [Argiope bruennichi]|uniref:Uncharacterized protein n=1 Tax=Argiope bruennichi TaxID=94029 RepID=A0A8T0F453_ARGBR|nr:hypothetical protein HNY73_011582 [Argiope bruennichi]
MILRVSCIGYNQPIELAHCDLRVELRITMELVWNSTHAIVYGELTCVGVVVGFAGTALPQVLLCHRNI